MLYQNTPWDNLDEPDFYADDYIPNNKNTEILGSPKSIYNYLDEKVYGQKEYKRAISVFIYKALKGINSEKVILIAAESGTGKSYLISELSKVVPNMVVADSSSMTASGYKGGNHITTMLSKVDTNGNAPCFIVLDEFNRLLDKGLNGWSETGLLAELLVLFDDKNVSVNAGTDEKPLYINPSNLFFILLGSFSNLVDSKTSNPIGFNADIASTSINNHRQITKEQILEQLSEWPELIGRISRVIVNQNLSEKDYLEILKSPKYSPAARIEKELNLTINITPKKIKEYAQESFASRTGFRKVKNTILEIVDEQLFKNPDTKEILIK